ncbi:hypothetical protein [Paenibacillus sp. NEAU-GSW1]|uniref:hypothetical protein n=1 Tax=Paenibacillus sp. NEAU-GSW1 TaxID=2682486 RepID=UPI0012E15296|nr:hypothetical protein [Paenibacillus sp. NEAU-GSW1]MUT65527.1 hypothetical protein [Paenibacillus sp. NEAU-GSW1]
MNSEQVKFTLVSYDPEKDITILKGSDGGQLIIEGSPTPDAARNFILHVMQMKINKRTKAKELSDEVGNQFVIYMAKGDTYLLDTERQTGIRKCSMEHGWNVIALTI